MELEVVSSLEPCDFCWTCEDLLSREQSRIVQLPEGSSEMPLEVISEESWVPVDPKTLVKTTLEAKDAIPACSFRL